MPRAPAHMKTASSGDHGLQKGNLTHQQRLAIVRKKDEEPRWTQEDLARWAKKQFGLQRQPTQSTISNILRARERLETMTTSLDAKSVRPVKHPELDAALLLWLRDRQSRAPDGAAINVPMAIHGELVRDKARQLSEFFHYADEMTYSTGWMRSFLMRHGVEFRRNQVDPRESLPLSGIRSLLAAYPKRDVFTLATTNLWYRLEPKKEPVTSRSNNDQEPSFVVALGVNMDGSEKWSPVFVSRAKEPPSFQQKSAFQWNFLEYYWNGRAQMTSTVFEVWVKRLNQRMAQSHRRIVLVVDSAPSHLSITLSHVRVVVHDAGDATTLAPLTSGIAHAFKAFYHRRHLASAVDRAEAGETTNRYAVSQLKAMRWTEQAWAELPAELVVDAWNQAGLVRLGVQSEDVEMMVNAIATKKTAIHTQVTGLLEELDVPGRIKSHDVVAPRGEDDAPHYVYDDESIVALVNGALHNNNAGFENDGDLVDGSELLLSMDSTVVTSQHHRQLLVKLEQLRGVIQTIDEDSPPSDEHATVLAFLRRRQATLRAELQRIAREAARMPTPMVEDKDAEKAEAGEEEHEPETVSLMSTSSTLIV